MRPRIRVRPRSGAVRIQVAPGDDWQRIGRRHFLTRDAYERATRLRRMKQTLWQKLRAMFRKG